MITGEVNVIRVTEYVKKTFYSRFACPDESSSSS